MQQVEFRQAGRAGNPEAKCGFGIHWNRTDHEPSSKLFSWTSGMRLEIINQSSEMKHL
jgi:hypothetical protein